MIALAQIRVDDDAEANTGRALNAINRAAKEGTKIVLLPEALPFGWTNPAAIKRAEGIPEGKFCVALREAAKKHGVFVCSGIIEKAEGRLFNAAVLIDPAGNVILHHRKIYELDIAHDLYSLGTKLEVARTVLGTIGMMICADAFAPGQVLARSLGLMGADLVLSPCGWAVPADHDNGKDPYGKLWLDNYGPVARDFRLWIAGCSNVGPIGHGRWRGRKCIGCSMVMGPEGKAVLRGPYGEDAETILHTTITPEPRPAQGTGWEEFWRNRT
jgi:predicted amidohydrolase